MKWDVLLAEIGGQTRSRLDRLGVVVDEARAGSIDNVMELTALNS